MSSASETVPDECQTGCVKWFNNKAGYGFLTPFVMITIAARIAPRFKVPTAVIMSILWVSYIGWFWLVGLEGRSIDILPTLIANILSAIGILVAWKYARPWWEESD